MDITATAGAIIAAQTGLARQEMAVQLVKQNIEATQAVAGLVEAATEQVKQAAAGAIGGIVDITV